MAKGTKSKTHNVYIAYACAYDGAPMQIDATEIEECKWTTREELQELPMFEDGKEVVDCL